jgi:NAD(P)-dependent dehydrogenase (short-subunit alcohol dehydrogenase family)
MASDLGMAGRVCVITGATAGIGRVTALKLARRGAGIVAIGRDRARGEALVSEIGELPGRPEAEFVAADLSSREGCRTAAEAVLARHSRIDVLLNNAGAMYGERRRTADGLEMTFALNHLGYFRLVRLLLPAVRAAAPARIVNVASNAHRGVRLDFDDLQSQRRYRGFAVYKRSKLANLYFTYTLARRLEGSGVTVNALHPGFVATDIGIRNRYAPKLLWRLACLKAIGVEEGAETSVYVASAPEVAGVSGKYFFQCRETSSSAASYDHDAALRLWQVSEALAGV